MSYTKREYRQSLARRLGGFVELTVSFTTGLNYQVNLTPISASDAIPTSAFAYEWVGVPGFSSIPQARIAQDGIDTTSGVVTLERSLGGVVGVNQLVELHTKLPPFALQRPPGPMSVDECVNLALRALLLRDDQVALALVSGQRDYALPSYLDRADRLIDVRVLDAFGTGYVSTHHAWEFREGARGNTLHFPQPFEFSAGSYAARLVVDRPADSLIKTGGVWGDATSGLVNETDEASPDLNAVDEVGLAFCYQTLRDGRAGAARAGWQALYEQQVPRARAVRHFDHSNDAFPDVPRQAEPAASEAA